MTNSAKFSSNELIAIFGNQNCHFVNHFSVQSVETDTRSMKANSLFIALKGENYDSHNFINNAIKNGAICIVVEQDWYEKNKENYKGINLIVTKNSIKALGKLANFHRLRFDIDIIAVAGSNGKTTTKEMIAEVLSSKYKVLKTYKNYNNQIGVPLMLFQLDNTIEKAVIEIGTNEPGEIFLLSEILSPTAGIITNIGKEHLEGFLDLDGVEAEETSLYAYLKKSDSVAFVNMDDERLSRYLPLFDNVFTYGQNEKNEYNLNAKITINSDLTTKIDFNNQEREFTINLKARGLNYAYNSIPAVAVGLFYKVPIEKIVEALENFTPDSTEDYGRMVVLQKNGVTFLNDTYNANPTSTILALETLALTRSEHKIAVLGDMLELGNSSLQEHIEIIEQASKIADYLLLFGPNYQAALKFIEKKSNIFHFTQKAELIEYLKNLINQNTTVLVKGSRGMRMEEVIKEITSK
mgnify:CR=1 FL=1